MSDTDASAAQAAMDAFLDALDRGDAMAAQLLLEPGATFTREVQGAALDLDHAAWFAFARGRDRGARKALLMNLTPEVAAFKVDTRLAEETLTDRVLLRRGAGGWRVASILSYP